MSTLAVLVDPARKLTLLQGEADTAHRIAPVGAVERGRRGELDIARAGRPGLTCQPWPARFCITRWAPATHWLSPSWRWTRISTVLGSPNSCSETSPTPRLPTVLRSWSSSALPSLALAWMAMPPLKSMPKLRPIEEDADDRHDVDQGRQDQRGCLRWPRKSNFLLKAKRRTGFHMAAPQITSSVGRRQRTQTAQQHAREDRRAEHRGDDAERQRRREAADRPGAEAEQQDGRR